MNQKRLFIMLAASISIAAAAHAFDLKKLKLPAATPAATTPVAGGDALATQQALVQRYVQGSTSFTMALRELALAWGLKDQVAKLDAEITALQSGAVSDKDSLKKNTQVSREAQAAVEERMNAGEKLSAEGKKHYAAAWAPYLQGIDITRTLPGEAKNFEPAIESQIKSASGVEKVRVTSQLAAGAYLVKESPGYFERMFNGGKKLVTYARSNDIPVPKDATALL